jgi:hypothetical protein
MKIREAALVLAAMCASVLAVPVAASAATTPTTTATSWKNVPITGKAHNGKAFNGHFTVPRFVTKNGKTVAEGTLTGKLGSKTIKSQLVDLPAALPSSSTASSSMKASSAATCPGCTWTSGR